MTMGKSKNRTIDLLSQKVFRRGIKYDLTNMQKALSELRHPEKGLPNPIHVAGTNGKGSTVGMLSKSLMDNGARVGSFTSPHIRSYCERICINQTPISQDRFDQYFNQVMAIDVYDELTEFEVLTLMALLVFKDSQPDYTCIEVGLGGRLDATNIISPILSIITKIGWDHADILGSTLSEIASEKAGIIKPNVPVLTPHTQNRTALKVIKTTATAQNAPLTLCNPITVMNSPILFFEYLEHLFPRLSIQYPY